LFLKTIETLVGEEYKLKFDSSQIQTLIGWLKNLNVDFSELGKATKEYNATLAAIDMKKLLLGPSFDADTERLEAYQKYLDEIIEKLSKKKPGEITLIDKQQIEEQIRLIEEVRKRIEATTDRNTLKLLQAEADAFGTIAGQVEVLNFAVQAEERALRSMLRTFVEGSKTGEIVTWEQIQDATKRIQDLKKAYVEAQNAMDLRFLYDMDNALHNVATGADVLSGRINALQNTLQIMSENGQGSTEQFKLLATEMQRFTNAQIAVDMLSGAFTDLFQGVIDGGKSMQEILTGILKNIMNEIIAMISKLIAMRIIMAMFPGMGGASVGAKALTGLNRMPGYTAPIIGLAQGGIVPPGYPNDSFPARLTSGEAILPLQNLNKYEFNKPTVAVLEGEVIFEIAGEKLEGLLKKRNRKNSIY